MPTTEKETEQLDEPTLEGIQQVIGVMGLSSRIDRFFTQLIEEYTQGYLDALGYGGSLNEEKVGAEVVETAADLAAGAQFSWRKNAAAALGLSLGEALATIAYLQSETLEGGQAELKVISSKINEICVGHAEAELVRAFEEEDDDDDSNEENEDEASQ